jgi:hypothetical protein
MKTKITLSLFALLIATILSAQNVPNGGFENWTDGEPDDWATVNIPGSEVITQSNDAFSGSFSVRGQSIEVNNDNLPVDIEAEGPPEAAGLGFPISEQFTKMTFRYKFDNGSNDQLIVLVSIRNADSVSMGLGSLTIEDNSEGWSIGTVLIDYTGEGTAAFAAVQIILQDQTGGDPPSTDAFFIIDDVELSSGATGVNNINKEDVTFTVSPQPADNRAKISINAKQSFSTLSFELFDLTGKKVADYRFEGINAGKNDRFIDVSNLNNGMYILKSVEGTLSTRIVVTH